MLALVTAVIAISATAAIAEDYQQLVKQAGPALVPIKFVLKISAGGEERETSGETTGVMIDDKGLIICSNTQLGGFVRFLRTKVGAINAVPSDLKVLVGNDTEGVAATFVARDTELDLAWLRIKKPSDTPYQYIDLTKSVAPKIGQTLLALRRMSKYFDRSPAITEVRVAGITHKPRELYIPSLTLGSALGSPVFDSDGALVGFAVLQAAEDSENSQAAIQEGAGMILPASEVLKATHRALEQATTQPAATQATHTMAPAATQPSR
jgi:S1-C subfamily serine protease